jgi:hypothetical protein
MPFDPAVPARFRGTPDMSVYRNQPGLPEPHQSGTIEGSFSHPLVVDDSDDSDDGDSDDYSPAINGDVGLPDQATPATPATPATTRRSCSSDVDENLSLPSTELPTEPDDAVYDSFNGGPNPDSCLDRPADFCCQHEVVTGPALGTSKSAPEPDWQPVLPKNGRPSAGQQPDGEVQPPSDTANGGPGAEGGDGAAQDSQTAAVAAHDNRSGGEPGFRDLEGCALRTRRVPQLTWRNYTTIFPGASLGPQRRLLQIEVPNSLPNFRRSCQSLLESHYSGQRRSILKQMVKRKL